MPDGEGDGDGVSRRDLERQAERAVEEGRAIEKIVNLLRDNYEERERRRQAEATVDRLPDQAVEAAESGEEMVILTGESVETYEAYTDLGEPDEIEEALAQREEAVSELKSRRRQERLNRAAELHGMQSEGVRKIVDADGLSVEIDEESETALVETEDGDKANLDNYVEENWAEFAPALKGETSEEEDDGDGGGTRFPEQSGDTSPSDSETTVEDVKKKKAESGDYRV